MAYPLIIFGAGASYDYSPLGKIAPLTNHLTNDEFLYPDLLEKYKGAGNLLSDIVHQVKTRNRNFEEVLTEMKRRTEGSKEMRTHFVALEFYLKDLFERISKPTDLTRKTHQINNYKSIINRINTYSNGKALIATFNYDTLFESNLLSKIPTRMKDYVSENIKIIKLHGSHDWVYINRIRSLEFAGEERSETLSGYEVCMANPDFIEQVKNQGSEPCHFQQFKGRTESSQFHWFPALAIPLIGKGRYIPPKNHIQVLEQDLPTIDRVLIIGWRAGDPLLLETLKRHLPQMGYKVLIVSNTKEGAEETAKTVRKGLNLINENVVSVMGGGFSGFVSDEISNTFFNS